MTARLLRGVVAALAALLVTAPAPSASIAQPAPAVPDTEVASALEGRWELAISTAEAQRRIDGGIGAVTRQMLPIVSGVARGRLHENNTLSPMISISFPADRIRVEFVDALFDTRAGYERTMPLPGQESTPVRVHQSVRGGALVQVFTTSEGRRWNTLSVRDDGTLSFDVVIRSSQMPSDVRYQLQYRRA